jgi:hypothetical protein
MTEADWLTATDPSVMLKFLQTCGSCRKVILFSCACVRRSSDCTTGSLRSLIRSNLGFAERYADGMVPVTELRKRFTTIGTRGKKHALPEKPWDWAECHADTEDQNSNVPCLVRITFLHDIFGNPFRPVTINPSWLTSTVLALANQMYDSRDFSAMPILADALQEAGCDNQDILNHCRQPGEHVRGCFLVDLLLGKK